MDNRQLPATTMPVRAQAKIIGCFFTEICQSYGYKTLLGPTLYEECL